MLVFQKVIELIKKYHLRLFNVHPMLNTSKNPEGRRMRQIQAIGMKRAPCGPPKDQNWGRVAARWRLIAYLAAVLPLLVIIVLARLYPDLNRQEIPDWKPVISLAEDSWNKGDLYQTRHLYLQAGRVASWRQDWAGLVAAACGIYRLDGINGPYSKALSILLRATSAAQARQSRRGILTVAKAFALIGADQVATAVLARIQTSWPDETSDSGNFLLLERCRARA
jgi:hypothetical protein